MLKELDSIEWKPLQHAYGSASDVPEQLKALASQSQSDRDTAWDKLYGNIFHQGTRYEASSYAIPFLIELILDKEVKEKNLIIDYLVSLSLGYEDEFIPDGVDIVKIRSELSTDGRCWEMSKHGLACYDLVLENLETLLPLIESSDVAVRDSTIHLLSWFPEFKEKSLPLLKRIAENSNATEDRVAAIMAIGILTQSEEVEYFQQFKDNSEPGVVLASAIVQPYSEETRDSLIDFLKEKNTDEITQLFSDEKHDPLSFVVQRLSEAETNLEPIITRLTSLLSKSSFGTCEVVLNCLLSILKKFEGKELSKEDFEGYSPLTKDALKAVLYCPGWKIGPVGTIIKEGTINLNYINIISAHNLPGVNWEEFEAMVNNTEYVPPHLRTPKSLTGKIKKKFKQFLSSF